MKPKFNFQNDVELVICGGCGGVFDRANVIQTNICSYSPLDNDLECWRFSCRKCNKQIKELE